MLIIISIHINLNVIFLVIAVIDSSIGYLVIVVINSSVLCIVEILTVSSILGAASWTWRQIMMLPNLPKALIASCLHCSVGAASIIVACIHHLLSSHFELVLHEPVVILHVLQVGVPVCEPAVASHLRRELWIHGLREVGGVPVVLALVALEEVIQALWASSCLLLLQGIFSLSLQLLVLYIISCLLSHVHQLECLPIGVSDDQAVLWINFLHACRHSLGAMT